ncbi:MAG: flippase-like protein [Gaiellaceae bacterium]|nr:flippase-like protein [Gaiellaceae bacterium]
MVAVAERVAELDGRFLAVALVLQLAALAFRALAWRGVLAAAYPERRIPLLGVGCAYAAGVAVNAFVPARGGEGAKVALVRSQLPGSSVATIASSLSVVLVLDTLLGAALMTTLWSLGRAPALPSPPSVGTLPLVAGIVALVAVAAGLLAVARSTAAVRRFLAAAARGFSVLRRPWTYASTVLPFQLSAWACRIAVVYLVLHAFRFEAGLETAVVLVVFTGVSTAVPVPGGAGSQQVLAAYALQGVVSTAGAVSFSLGMQVGVTAVNAAVGLAATMLLFRTIRPLAAVRAARGRTPQ